MHDGTGVAPDAARDLVERELFPSSVAFLRRSSRTSAEPFGLMAGIPSQECSCCIVYVDVNSVQVRNFGIESQVAKDKDDCCHSEEDAPL